MLTADLAFRPSQNLREFYARHSKQVHKEARPESSFGRLNCDLEVVLMRMVRASIAKLAVEATRAVWLAPSPKSRASRLPPRT